MVRIELVDGHDNRTDELLASNAIRVCPSCEGICYAFVTENGEVKKIACDTCKGSGFVNV
jgi:DnaJ-class molecular chaperone